MPSSSVVNQGQGLVILTIQKLFDELLTLTSQYATPELLNLIRQSQEAILSQLPVLQTILYDLIDAIFSPQLLLKQLAVALGLQVAVFTLQRIGGLIFLLLNYLTEKGRKSLKLNQRMKEATTYLEWKRLGEQCDMLKGLILHLTLTSPLSLTLSLCLSLS
jgi:hypothetical protein